ncbi:MAG: methyltransferase domain-containing protein [Thermoplasmatales archaeon]|nr:methyltransferase domain-containing protein [Thermoplasmatales archaeon]
MKILIELSKEYPTLPLSEAKACMGVCGIDYKEIYHNSILIAEVNKDDFDEYSNRVALTFSVNEIISEDLENFIEKLNIQGSFKIEGGNYEIRRKLGEIIKSKKNLIVDLERPDNLLKIFSGKKEYFCREIKKIDRKQFEMRKPNNRPFHPPVSMHPKIARALVNLTQVRRGQTLLDPFCGSGGLLIEACLIGVKSIGVDIKKKMVEGCRENMNYYGIENYEVFNMDMRDLDIKVDAVATDFPYGRSSHISDEMSKLYKDAIEKINDFLRKGRKVVIGLPSLEYRGICKNYFNIEEIHCFRAHRSLTRFFYVLSKS